MDQFTETTRTGYGQNIGNSFKGIFIGILLIIGSIILLWWNEGRSVEQATALAEMQTNIITLPNTKYDIKNENKAILLQGLAKPLNQITDPEFGVTTDGLVLRKHVEMYQWKENTSSKSEDKLGGSTETVTTYSYVKEWSSWQIDSSSFKHPANHQNPLMTHKSETFSTDAQLGDYYLSKNVVSHIGASDSYQGLTTMPEQIGVARNYKSYLYIGFTPQTPSVGDMKITYTYAPSAVYTFAGKSYNKTLTSYTTKNGKSFMFVRNGKVSAETIFKEELDANSLLTWILRGVGLLIMFIGFSMVMGPLATIAKVIPMLGSLVGGATGIIAGVLTLILGSVIIALAWFTSRPLLSLGILAVGVAIAVAMAKFGKKKEQEPMENSASSSTPPPRSDATPPPRS
ncbi:MAG: TMEM43 family protein [Campylobacterota bacterium]|nr:TMEM43 family protein [Campylobacterota bacterium]